MITKISARAGFAAGAAVGGGLLGFGSYLPYARGAHAPRLRLLPAVRARPRALPPLSRAARLLLRGDGSSHSCRGAWTATHRRDRLRSPGGALRRRRRGRRVGAGGGAAAA